MPKGTLESISANSPFTAAIKAQSGVAADGLSVTAGGAGSVVLTDLDLNRLFVSKTGYAFLVSGSKPMHATTACTVIGAHMHGVIQSQVGFYPWGVGPYQAVHLYVGECPASFITGDEVPAWFRWPQPLQLYLSLSGALAKGPRYLTTYHLLGARLHPQDSLTP